MACFIQAIFSLFKISKKFVIIIIESVIAITKVKEERKIKWKEKQ